MFGVKASGSSNSTVIAEGVKIEGKLFTQGTTWINGTVIGDINSENALTIGITGIVESNIKTKDAVISGNFKGKMTASGEVEITSTGRFTGTLTQKSGHFSINKGGLFNGRCIIEDDENAAAIDTDNRKKASTPSGQILALKKQVG